MGLGWLQPPSWVCCGWLSWWCVLDTAFGCRVRWVCDRHDRSITEAGG